MQWSVTLLISVLLVGGLGCTNPQGPKDGSTPPPAKTKSGPSKPAKNAPNAPPVIEPVTAFSGRVVLVNAPLKYIVVEGTLGRVPAADQSLNVYRDGQKVGVVIVSNQSRGANFAADLAEGEVRVGDTVRSD